MLFHDPRGPPIIDRLHWAVLHIMWAGPCTMRDTPTNLKPPLLCAESC